MKRSVRSRLLHFILKIFYRLLYHRMAWTYDLVAWLVSAGLWKEWVGSVLPYLNGPHILELGHGPGHLQKMLLEADSTFSTVVGVDRSKQMGWLASKRLRRKGNTPKIINGEAQFLPFQGEYFDQVVATFPSEYIADPAALKDIRRVLKPGGSLIILPVAYITGKRLHERAAASLFQITGQSPQWDERALEPAWKAGFETLVERVELEASSIILILARKPMVKS